MTPKKSVSRTSQQASAQKQLERKKEKEPKKEHAVKQQQYKVRIGSTQPCLSSSTKPFFAAFFLPQLSHKMCKQLACVVLVQLRALHIRRLVGVRCTVLHRR